MYTTIRDRPTSARLRRGALFGLATAFSVAAILLFASPRGIPPAASVTTGPWVADHKLVKHVDPARHLYDQQLVLAHEAEALAVDPKDASLWVLVEHRLLHLAGDGRTLLDLALKQFAQGLGDPRLLVLNAFDGTLWVGAEKTVLHLSVSGQLLAKWSSSDELKAIVLDLDENLWALTKKRVVHLSPQAAVLHSVAISGVLPEPEYLALDRLGGTIWIAGKQELYRLDLGDLSKPPSVVKLPQVSSFAPSESSATGVAGSEPRKIEGLVANPLSGDLWLVADFAIKPYTPQPPMISTTTYTPCGHRPLTLAYVAEECLRHEERRSQKTFLEAVALKSEGLTTAEIARRLAIRRATLSTWFQHDRYRDQRGWTKGELRKYSPAVRDRVIALKRARIEQEKYFLGAPYVQMDYAKRYPKEAAPSLWFINESVRSAGLQMQQPRKRTKGKDIVKRLHFPIKTIVTLGRIQQACDYIGKKYIYGSSEPISILSTGYYQWFEIHQI